MDDVDDSSSVFLFGSRTFRNAKTILVMVACILLAYFPTCAAIKMLRSGEANPVGLFATVVSLCFAYCLLLGVSKIIQGRVVLLIVAMEGIRYGGSFWTWEEIASIGVSRRSFTNGLWLAVELRNSRIRSLPVRVRRELSTDRPLTADDYDSFTIRIRPWLREHHPHVRIDLSELPTLK